MSIIIDCFDEVKFYDYLLFDTVFLHRVNYMQVYLYKDLYYYYQNESGLLLTKNRLKNDDYIPGILDLSRYIERVNNLLSINYFNVTIDNYKNPLFDIKLNNISRNFKINKIKDNL